MDHLFKEKDLKNQCLYCGNDLFNNRWVSQFHERFHYKVTRCNCGKLHSIKENCLLSSGHDNWDGKWIKINEINKIKKEMNLENKLFFS